jgi:nitrile hydratase beta subunit-like protein
VADRFAPGDRVRTRSRDPAGHTRLPRYARGAPGEIVQVAGHHPLADDRARGRPASPKPSTPYGSAPATCSAPAGTP